MLRVGAAPLNSRRPELDPRDEAKRRDRAKGMRFAESGEKYGVSPQRAHQVVNRRR
jgi:hypothetical protein